MIVLDFFLAQTLILLENSPNKSTSTLILAQLGLIILYVVRSTYHYFSTLIAKEKNHFLYKKFEGKDGNEI